MDTTQATRQIPIHDVSDSNSSIGIGRNVQGARQNPTDTGSDTNSATSTFGPKQQLGAKRLGQNVSDAVSSILPSTGKSERQRQGESQKSQKSQKFKPEEQNFSQERRFQQQCPTGSRNECPSYLKHGECPIFDHGVASLGVTVSLVGSSLVFLGTIVAFTGFGITASKLGFCKIKELCGMKNCNRQGGQGYFGNKGNQYEGHHHFMEGRSEGRYPQSQSWR
jgi:hypothetical protein